MADKTPLTTRRDFMRASAAAAVGAGVLGNLSMAAGAFAGGDDAIRIGLVGCGGRGSGAAQDALSTSHNVKLVAMGDVFEDHLQPSLANLQKAFAGQPDRVAVEPENCFVGFDAYQKVIDSGVDLVILATPPGFRPIHFEAAVAAGKHVFMEKPVATDSPGVRRVLAGVEEAKKKNLKVGVGLQRHHVFLYQETMKRLHDGEIGDIVAMRCYWNGSTPWEPRRTRAECRSEMEYQLRNWYYYNWLCGDHICEQHIHNLDVCNWLKGSYPVSAFGMGGRQVRTGPQYGEIYDHHAVEFVYEDGSRAFSQCRQQDNTWKSVSEHAHGTKGTADISGGRIKGANGAWRFDGEKNTGFQTEHHDLLTAIRDNISYNEGEYGAKSTLTAIMGRFATYTGKEITWEQAMNSEVNLMPEEFSWDAKPRVVPNEHGAYPVAMPGLSEVL